MGKTKDNMLMHGFILVTILATAKSAEAEITMEAAFQVFMFVRLPMPFSVQNPTVNHYKGT
ncbi:hypothetical protein FF38_09926 [Lucilia cuprina]|uniref:Uncharacterized protein n=1 Tax=Lucilia cuprina TaxID=7375 RepID=A0A0L0C8Q7_LUCCU|nr:hypothetical protein FF38_09926 [Lucilia cuprina]